MGTIESWPGSEQRWERARRTLGGGVSTGMRASMKPHPLFFSHGAGSHLIDVDGNDYVDYVLGWGPVILGHAHPELVRVVGEQLPLGQTFGSGHHWEYEVAEQVVDAIPGVERVLWSNTGTEANQVALRLARAFTGRRKFIKFEGHYHGWSDTMLLAYRPDAQGSLDGLGSRGQNPQSRDDVVVLPWNDIEAVRAALSDPDNDIAAVFTEPVLCNSGVLPPAEGFLAELRQVTEETGTLLIFDEVITGFRIAYGGGAQRFGVRPDLVVLAKAIAGGFPLAAIGGRADIIEQMTAGVVHAGTYNGNPVVLAAAAATLSVLRGPGVYETFEKLSGQLVTGFTDAFARHGVAAEVHHVGPVVQTTPGRREVGAFGEYLAGDWAFYDDVTVELLRRGIFTLPGGRWYLSTAHDADDVARTVAAFDEALGAVVASRG